jgi:hypothetical protein
MSRIYIFLPVLLLCNPVVIAGSTEPRTIGMTIKPISPAKTTLQIRFLPKVDEMTDGDAVPLYEKAIKSLSPYYPEQKFGSWRRLSAEQLPVQEVESELNKLKTTLDILAQATKSKECKWPEMTLTQVQQANIDLSKYRQLAFILDTQAKIQIQQKQYAQVIETLKTGLTMSKHLGEAPIMSQGLVALAIAELNMERIEQLIQSENAPSLQDALKSLPQPFVDIEKAIKYETDNFVKSNSLRNSLLNVIGGRPTIQQLQPAFDRTRIIMNHLERRITTLQIIETLRVNAAAHDGKFPEKLSDLTQYEIPNDPVTKKPFSYTSTGINAVLELEGTEGSDGRDAIRYELNLK